MISMRRAMGAVVALFLVALTWAAIWVPFHATDALIYGRWSRLIALGGPVADVSLGAGYLHRPVLYVGQGWLWELFGFHEWIGRLWALLFLFVLVYAVWRLAAQDAGGHVTGALAAVLLVATPDVVSLGAAGLTDVPVAAMVALTGLLVLGRLDRAGGSSRMVLAAGILLAAALAGLTKPSAFIALAGIGLALLIGPRATLAARVVWRGVPLAAGTVLALVWAAIQAHRLGFGLTDFLKGTDETLSTGVVNFYEQLNAQSRGSFIAGMEWLGPYLTLPLIFGIVYAVVRVAGRPHRLAATIAAPVAIVLSWLLPFLADPAGGAVGPYDLDRPIAVLGTLALFVPLWLSRDCPPQEAPSRTQLARMLAWALLPTVAWITSAPFQTRYLSPAWAPLFVLVALALWTALRGLAVRGPRWAWAVVAIVCVLGVVDLRNVDGLGSRPDGSVDAARTVRELGVSGWFDTDRARAAADPTLAALVGSTGAALAEPGRLLSVDGRLGFYWPLRTVRGDPQRCADLRGFRTFVAVISASGLDARREARLSDRDLAEATGGRAAQIQFWQRCRDPVLRPLRILPGQFAVFRVAP